MSAPPGADQGDAGGGAEAGVERAAAVLGARARRGVPVGPLTTYRVGGPAALLLEATGEGDLALVQEAVSASAVPVLVLGKGSNLLVADAGFPGLVVTLGEPFTSIEVAGDGLVRAGGAVSLPVLARRTVAAGLTGMEWAVGVPGSVGGAVRMNAGGHGSDVSRTLVRCGLVDLRLGRIALGTSESQILSQRVDLFVGRLKSAALFRFVPFQVLGERLQATDLRLRFVSLGPSAVEVPTESVDLF